MLNNQLRRQLLERHKQSGFPGSIIDVYKAYEQGVDIISNFEQQQMQQQMQVAQTPLQQQEGLRPFHQAGNTNQSMVFPNVPPNTPFNTVGMKAPINIEKYDKQGHLVKSYQNVPPGIKNLPTGPNEGTVIETPANMQSGGFKPAPKRGGVKRYQTGNYLTPTRADSLALYNNALEKIAFYENNPDYYIIKNNNKSLNSHYQNPDKRKNIISSVGQVSNNVVDAMLAESFSRDARDYGKPLTQAEMDAMDDAIGDIRFGNVPGTNLTSFGDIIDMQPDRYFNPLAPPIYLHPNIAPQNVTVYVSRRFKDTSEVPNYDPIAIAPWDILTPKEQNQRINKYGYSGTPYEGRQNTKIDQLNPIQIRQINQTPEKRLQIGQQPIPKNTRPSEPIMRADFSRGIARQGQYQIGERYWDDNKKRWKEDRWSPEEIKESKRIAIEGLKPPGEYVGKFEFGYGGRRKYQSGGSGEQLYPQSTINLPPAEIVANAPEAPSEKIPWYSTINFRKWGLRDYGDDVNFGKAFRDAFNRGEEQFVWRGDRFSTKMKETTPEPAVPKQKQPTKPFKNEYDPFSPMGVASFLGNKYDGTPEAALALADTIGYHESDKGMDPKQKQHNNGPARGLYQIEPESMGTYIQRAKNYAADNKLKVPDWIMNAPEDASELTRDQQTALFLINMAMHPNTNMRKYFSGNMSTEDMWMAGWKEKPAAGGTDRNAFKTSIKSAQQLGIPNAYSTQPPPPKIQPPPAKEDELPSGVITPPPGLKAGGFKYPRYPKKVSYNNKRMN